MQRLRKGDEVIVLSGASKGVRGSVEHVVYHDGKITHVLVNGVNKHWKHTQGNPAAGEPGGRIQKEIPLPASKVALFNEKKGGADRVKISIATDGTKKRVFVSNGEEV